jgi:diacylglycerol kinase family enzyme
VRALLVVNPAATTTTSRTRDVLVSALASDLKVDVVHTTHRGHASELGRRAAEDGLDAVAVLGGDGTINEVINGILAEGPAAGLPALGVVPGGSTNVFARSLGIPADPVEATGELLEALRTDRTRTIGLGRADERWFTFTAGLGLDADAVRLVELARARGKRATPQLYASCAMRRFFRTDRRHPPLVLSRPGEAPVDHLFLTVVSNTAPWTYIGSKPVVMTPSASFDSGLDVVALSRLRFAPTLLAAARMLSRKGIRGRSVLRLTDLSGLTVTASRPQPFQVDGDYLGERRAVAFSAVPNALRVIV